MSKYAIIQINHNQYFVEEGKEYTVPKFSAEIGKLTFKPLAANVKDGISLGADLDKVNVEIEVMEQGKGEKVTTRVFRAKARYRKTTGFRKRTTTFKVLSIK